LNQKDYDQQLTRLPELLKEKGKLLILTLPENSDHYKVMLRQVYPVFNYAEYIVDFYKKLGLKVDVEKLKMRLFVGDMFTTNSRFDLKMFYRFIHNTDSYPSDAEAEEFLGKIKKCHKDGYLDFKDYLVVVTK
jgi:hypothetical protein